MCSFSCATKAGREGKFFLHFKHPRPLVCFLTCNLILAFETVRYSHCLHKTLHARCTFATWLPTCCVVLKLAVHWPHVKHLDRGCKERRCRSRASPDCSLSKHTGHKRGHGVHSFHFHKGKVRQLTSILGPFVVPEQHSLKTIMWKINGEVHLRF